MMQSTPAVPPFMWWGVVALASLAGLVGVWLLHQHTPGVSPWLPPCMFHRLTGLYCPGCGATRAMHALVHGQVLLALRQNPLAVIAMPVVAVLWLDRGLSLSRCWRVLLAPLRSARLWAAAIIVFVIARNLPWFSWLAPV